MTMPDEELDRLAAALRQATPAPAETARARAKNLALAAQGPAAPSRPKDTRPRRVARSFGGFVMHLPLRPLLYGTASAAVIGLAVVLASNPDLLRTEPLPPATSEAAPVAKPLADAGSMTLSPGGGEKKETPLAQDPPEVALTVDEPEQAQSTTAPAGQLAAAPEPATAAPPPDLSELQALRRTEPSAAQADAVGKQRTLRLDAPSAAPPAAPKREAAPEVYFMGDHAPQATPGPVPPVADLQPEAERDRFKAPDAARVKLVAEEPVSTFSIDVDTASYSWVRRAISGGSLPDPASVRIEEMVNYFPYDYPRPESRETPFSTTVNLMPTPWNPGTQLMRIGIRGFDLDPAQRPAANIVFLIDTSGSMAEPDKLPLLINAFRLLAGELKPADQVAIVAYAGSAGVVLEPTPAGERGKILAALDRLEAGGSTAGGEGILAAYALAGGMRAEGEITRVILATDGDFNVGLSDDESLKKLVEEKRADGIFLSVLGFGAGNYNDALMQTLAQNGNGQAAYIDSLSEARKVLVEGFGGAVFPIAKDVKIQVEFNPATVAEYRLIGYETRALAREDFNNDRIDAGEIGAGHTVTALYELTPVGSPALQSDPLRYQADATAAPATLAQGGELAFVKLRYKLPEGTESRLITRPVTGADAADSPDLRFAAAVAGAGQLLTGAAHTGGWGWAEAEALARSGLGPDPFGYRAEFLRMLRDAGTLAGLARP